MKAGHAQSPCEAPGEQVWAGCKDDSERQARAGLDPHSHSGLWRKEEAVNCEWKSGFVEVLWERMCEYARAHNKYENKHVSE